MAINFAAVQGVLKLLKEAGPLVNELKNAYAKRGASEEEAQTAAELTVVLEQLLEKKLEDVPRQRALDKLRMELLRELSMLRARAPERAPLLPWMLLGTNLVTIVLLIVVLVRL
ncbi:MAG: hypothetical protein ACOY4L_12375 [Pseudomonadota bacterium]